VVLKGLSLERFGLESKPGSLILVKKLLTSIAKTRTNTVGRFCSDSRHVMAFYKLSYCYYY